jgi:hypothetical protein
VKSYLSGLCVAGLGLCGGGWLIMAALAFPGEAGNAGRVNLATGAALVLVGSATAAAWAVAWRRRLRADGVLKVPLPPRPGYGGNDYGGGTGHDGASAADALGELCALLGPLLTAAGANQVPAQLPWPQSLPAWPASPGPVEQWPAEQWLTEQWPADVPPGAQWRPRHRPAGHAEEPAPQAQPVPPAQAESRQLPPSHPSPCPRPQAEGPASDDELLRIADGEEAWW